MNVAVTGVNGFVGSHLIPALIHRGHGVRALARTETSVLKGAVRIMGTTASDATLTKLLGGSELVINLIGRFDPPFEEQVVSNVISPLQLFTCAGKLGIKRVIHISASAVYGDLAIKKTPTENDPADPSTSYGLSKLLGEEAVRFCAGKYALEPVILRPTNIYGIDSRVGVLQSMMRSCKERGLITISGDGEQVRDFIHVEDLVAAIVSIVEKPKHGALYNIASGEAITLNQLAKIFVSASEKPIRIRHSVEAEGFVRALRADNSRLIHDYGWKPRYNVTDTIHEMFR